MENNGLCDIDLGGDMFVSFYYCLCISPYFFKTQKQQYSILESNWLK